MYRGALGFSRVGKQKVLFDWLAARIDSSAMRPVCHSREQICRGCVLFDRQPMVRCSSLTIGYKRARQFGSKMRPRMLLNGKTGDERRKRTQNIGDCWREQMREKRTPVMDR